MNQFLTTNPISRIPSRCRNGMSVRLSRSLIRGDSNSGENGAKNKTNKFSPEVRAHAVRMVQEHRGEYPSLWAAVESIAPEIGCVLQTLLAWVQRSEINSGERSGVTAAEAKRVKELERENKELRRANEILKLANAFLAQAELDKASGVPHRRTRRSVGGTAVAHGRSGSRAERMGREWRLRTVALALAQIHAAIVCESYLGRGVDLGAARAQVLHVEKYTKDASASIWIASGLTSG